MTSCMCIPDVICCCSVYGNITQCESMHNYTLEIMPGTDTGLKLKSLSSVLFYYAQHVHMDNATCIYSMTKCLAVPVMS